MTETMAPPPEAPASAVTLEVRDVTKSFGSVQALTEVDFEVRAGEVMALVGDNGAGKSTLIKCIAGIHPIDSGELYFDGKKVTIANPRDSAALGIEVVYQDLALCENLDTSQNMFLGREEHDVIRRLKEPEMEARTAATMKSLAVTTIRSMRQQVASLSGGQRQSVAIGRAVLWNSRLVILDEPTAALGVAQTRQVLDLVARLAAQGLGGRHHLPQPARRLRGRRPDHVPPPRAQRRGLRAARDDAAGGRAGDHRRRADKGRRDTGHGRGGGTVSADATPVAPEAPDPMRFIRTASGRLSAAATRR